MPTTGPQEGDGAPGFDLAADGFKNATASLQEFRGKNVILYFYPRDDTPGCTTEAIAFTAQSKAFADIGAIVLGVSRDTIAKHQKFRSKHDLGIVLLSDPESELCKAYGVWVEKNLYGKKSMGIERSTFLIDASGKIAAVWRKVKVDGHVDQVLAKAIALNADHNSD